jgi:hypothetical protein
MAYAITAAGSNSQASGNFTISVSGVTYAGGETSLVVATGDVDLTTPTVSDGTNTYTLLHRQSRVAIFRATGVAAGNFTVTASTANGALVQIACFKVTGLTTAAPQDTDGVDSFSPGGTGGSDNITSPALTVSAQPALVFAACWGLADSKPAAGTGFTDLGPMPKTGAVGHKRVTATGSVTPTFTTTDTFFGFDVASVVLTEDTGGGGAVATPYIAFIGD